MTITMKRRMVAWLLTMSFLSPMAVALGCVWYTNSVDRHTDRQWHEEQRRNDQRFCDFLKPYTSSTKRPTTPYQQDTLNRLRKLSRDLGCVK